MKRELTLLVTGAVAGISYFTIAISDLVSSKVPVATIENSLKKKPYGSDVAYLKTVDLAPPKLDASSNSSREAFIDWMENVATCEGDQSRACRAALGVTRTGMLQLAKNKPDKFELELAARASAYVFVQAGELDYPTEISKEFLASAGWRFPTGVDGDALHSGHQIAGMVAVKRGDLKAAGEHLNHSLETFSPVTHSFGPRMHLAKMLLEKGEFGAVKRYFLRCKEGWSFAQESGIDGWVAAVEKKQIPSDDHWLAQLGYL